MASLKRRPIYQPVGNAVEHVNLDCHLLVRSSMSSRLDRITDWPKLAEQARYSARALAMGCGVSVRQLERFFKQAMGEPPHCLLNRLREQKALEHLKDGCTVKETAARLGYKNPANFSREFRKAFGLPTSERPKQSAQRPAAS